MVLNLSVIEGRDVRFFVAALLRVTGMLAPQNDMDAGPE
jgi:hypothetical protein